VFCVGRNYAAHAAEMGSEVDREAPFYFTKSSAAVLAAGGVAPYPPGTRDYQHEVELVVAIGAAGERVAEADALDLVVGYACGLDMTRRDLQAAAKARARPWDLGKDADGSAIVAPIARAADVGHPASGRIWLAVDGVVRQDDDLADMVWPVPALIAHLSRFYRLRPGDLIFTGTPAGVGPVAPGARLAAGVAGLPELRVAVGPAG
jgi:fumarylpyruvate hydrolase